MKRIIALSGILALVLWMGSCKDQPAEPQSPVTPGPDAALVMPDNPPPPAVLPAATVKLEEFPEQRLSELTDGGAATITPSELRATVAPGGSITEHKTVFLPADVAPPKGDIMFAIDLTGSMSGELANVKVNSVNIMNAIRGLIPDSYFGLISHMDYVGVYGGCLYGPNTYGSGGGCGDYPYALNHALTASTGGVATAINALPLGCGADGPEDYTRVMYESYSDAAIAWRAGAQRILLFWQDAVPHDCNPGVGCIGWGSTGPDPGRDATVGTADDLDLATVLQGMADNDIVLISLHSAHSLDPAVGLWECYAEKTGGQSFRINTDGTIPGGTDIATAVAGYIKEVIAHIDELTLAVKQSEFASWLTDVDPTSYGPFDLDEDKTFEFDITITVPDGTEPGEYEFDVCAYGDGVEYVCQHVVINTVAIKKEKLSGPDEVGIYSTNWTPFSFLITYTNSAQTFPVRVVDIVPAEFEVTELFRVDGIGTAAYDWTGKTEKSATRIEWDLPAGTDCSLGCALKVNAITVRSPGGKPVYKPTSCGALPLNDGATAYEVDLLTGDIKLVAGEPVIVVGPSDALPPAEAVAGTKPCAPDGLTVSLVDLEGAFNLFLNWDDNVETVDHYNVYRSIDGGPFTAIGEADVSEYDDTQLAPGYYCYHVKAAFGPGDDAEGNESQTKCETVPVPLVP